jgi:hypothetical protein
MIGTWRLIAVLATLWLGRAGGVAAGSAYDTNIDNAVGACLRIERRPVVVQRNLVLLPTTLSVKRSVAECGCKAAALTYRVTDRTGRQMMVGDIWTVERDRTRVPFDFTFVLSADASTRAAPPLRVSLSCAAAD